MCKTWLPHDQRLELARCSGRSTSLDTALSFSAQTGIAALRPFVITFANTSNETTKRTHKNFHCRFFCLEQNLMLFASRVEIRLKFDSDSSLMFRESYSLLKSMRIHRFTRDCRSLPIVPSVASLEFLLNFY